MFLYIRSITGDSIASRNAIYKYHNGPLGGHCSNRNTVLKKFISVADCLNTANFKRKNSICQMRYGTNRVEILFVILCM